MRESSVNMILRFAIYVNRKVCESQIKLVFVILSEKLANICVISYEIAKILEIWLKHDFTIKNWSKTWFFEMLKFVFEH